MLKNLKFYIYIHHNKCVLGAISFPYMRVKCSMRFTFKEAVHACILAIVMSSTVFFLLIRRNKIRFDNRSTTPFYDTTLVIPRNSVTNVETTKKYLQNYCLYFNICNLFFIRYLRSISVLFLSTFSILITVILYNLSIFVV